MDYFAKAPAKDALYAYRTILGFLRYKQPAVVRMASLQIANNSAVGVLIENKLNTFPHTSANFGDRLYWLDPLGSIPAAWSARILGKYLMDTTPMVTIDIPTDTVSGPNYELAAWGLSQMGFSDAPTSGKLEELSKDNIQKWKQWWIANEGRIEERIREINPNYNPVTPKNATPSTFISSQSKTTFPTSKPEPTQARPIPKVSDKLDFTICIGIGIVFLGLIGIAAALFRKRNSH
jgi:hypothetical protein